MTETSAPTTPKNVAAEESKAAALKEEYGQVVLVLQGGGALGAYQVGVYQARTRRASTRTG